VQKDIRYLKGVGEKKAALFEKLDIQTVEDLTRLLPRRYDDLGNIVDISSLAMHRGEKVSILATVAKPVTETRIKGGKTLTTVYVSDDSGLTKIVYFNNKFIKNMLHQGERYLFYGKLAQTGTPQLVSPEFYKSLPQNSRLLAVYPLVNGLNQKFLRKLMPAAVKECVNKEPLPNSLREKYDLLDINEAVYKIHFPKSYEDIDKSRRRLIFDELFYYSLGLQMLRGRKKKKSAVTVKEIPTEFLNSHSFLPTDAQSRALNDIYADLSGPYAMNRLLQGDVGSGKTLVAGQCAYCVIRAGAQAVIMAPTEVLANQHYRYFEKMFSPLGIKTALITSSVPAAQKRKICADIASGVIDFVVGTHAVLEKSVEFKNLGLVITDEQHRFGVMQRSALAGKAEGTHVLVMSATPIPRTLALMMWGDLDLSVIDSLPKGRQQVKTYLVDSTYTERLHAFIKKQTDLGGRVYIVCPTIEGDEDSTLASAMERADSLSKIFGNDKVGLVHGKMKPTQKDKVMTDFANGNISILVSTTVIEVGINVPEATLMIIENAERFGLSQLHQLRGRVGRGNMQSYCVLQSDNTSELTNTRLDFFTKTTDGFEIAQKDLELRGPGNFFGRDQHGLAGLQIADLQTDTLLLKSASDSAKQLILADSELKAHPLIKQNVLKLFESKGEIFN